MDIRELESFNLSDAVKFHDELNPKLWYNNRLRPEVKKQLTLIAEDFLEELGIRGIDVVDLTISGSNAAYSYTSHSDLDLHILVDMEQLKDEVYRELLWAKKTIYNDTHNITIHGVPIELYVQDSNDPVVSLGEYSILQNKWVKVPSKKRANFDQTTTKAKYDKLHALVIHALKSRELSVVNNVIKKIKQYRKTGLDKGGEFSPENLVFKVLRNQDYITKLYDLRDKLHSEELTIETMYSQPGGKNKLLNRPTLSIRMIAAKHGVPVKDIIDQLKKGIQVEKEHTTYSQTAREIALDHLAEKPDYYTKLKKVNLEEVGGSVFDLTAGQFDEHDEGEYETHEYQQLSESKTRYNEIEFVCANPNFPEATDVELQQRLFKELKKIPNVIPLMQDWNEYDEGQRSLSAIYKDQSARNSIIKLAKKLGVQIDLEQEVSNDYVDRAIRGEHEGQVNEGKTATHLQKLPRFFKDNDPLAELVPERKTHTFALHPDKWQSTFYSLTGKDPKKLRYYKPAKVEIVLGTLVGDMGFANQFYRAKTDEEKLAAALNYKKSLKSYDQANVNDYRMPELLIPRNEKYTTESASGYIPSEKEKNDPRYSMALTVDVHPKTMKNNAKKFGNKISRAGIPPTLRANGKF